MSAAGGNGRRAGDGGERGRGDYYEYIPVPLDAGGDNCVVLIPSAIAGNWSVAYLRRGGGGGGGGGGGDGGGEGGSRMVQMRPVGIAVGRAIPGGDRHGDIHDGMGAPAEGHAAADERRQPILPILINAFEKKTDLEKSWERDQLAYGMLLLGSFIYIAAVTSSMANDQSQLTRVLITFGTLWCLLAMNFLLHLHAKDSSLLQKCTSLAPRLFLVAFSYLVVLYISYSIPNKQAGRVYIIVKCTLLSFFYAGIIVWLVLKRCFGCRTSTSPTENVDPHVSSWSPLNRFVSDRDESGAFIFPPTRLR